MTFQPVLPPVILIVIAVVVVAFRLLNMRRLHTATGARWSTVWRWSGLTLAVLLILIASARPGIEHGDRGAAVAARSGENTNVFLIVDRSADSAVEDYGDGQSRMSGIRSDIEALIDRYPQARFAMVAFASRSSLDWPLSEDAFSLQPVVARLTPYPAADATEGVNAAAASNVLRYQLIAARPAVPRLQKPGVLFRFGRSRFPRTPRRVRTERRCGGRRGRVRLRRGTQRTGTASGRDPTRCAVHQPRRERARHRRHPGRRRISAERAPFPRPASPNAPNCIGFSR